MVRTQMGGQPGKDSIQAIAEERLRAIIGNTTPEAMQALVAEANRFGRELSSSLTTSQIRNIFGEVRSIEQEVPVGAEKLPITVQRRLLMLKPKLAYQVGRFSNNKALRAFADTISKAIDLVGDDARRFHTFVDLFEAILAYHRYYGGKTN
ncbi:type III-A CRISPR-associated protein Csm2 [uncultured Chloroflexus sp.]|uniref:type III-A CRISPR-associated protein Csm2 n=1 Tax=uncultured Chloroflexus sp. TaxID=214040 RepID=UPI002610E10D|nr:type III-A CRISPR-associated protein Csm2 [uncultured Chloroflexus sp.]